MFISKRRCHPYLLSFIFIFSFCINCNAAIWARHHELGHAHSSAHWVMTLSFLRKTICSSFISSFPFSLLKVITCCTSWPLIDLPLPLPFQMFISSFIRRSTVEHFNSIRTKLELGNEFNEFFFYKRKGKKANKQKWMVKSSMLKKIVPNWQLNHSRRHHMLRVLIYTINLSNLQKMG